jgi:hypothetical protein
MNQTLHNCLIFGAILGAFAAAEIALPHHLPTASDRPNNATAIKNLAQCEQDLHAIHSRGWTYTFEPFGYDWDGKPAIKVTDSLALNLSIHPEGTLLWVVQTAECYASKGARWDLPINVIYNLGGVDNFPLARYDGDKVVAK